LSGSAETSRRMAQDETMASVRDLVVQSARRTHLPAQTTLPRVLYALALTPGHKFGSIEEQILTLAERFRDGGSVFLPLFICGPGDSSLKFYHAKGIDAEALDLRRLRPGTLRRLLGLLSTHQIEVVHWNFTSPLGNPYLWALTVLRPRLRHFLTDHISRPWPVPVPPRGPRRLAKRVLARRYERVFCVSRFVRDCLDAQASWPSERLRTGMYFINTDRFRPDPKVRADLRRKLACEERFVVLTAAYLIPAKGIDVLIRALAELPAAAVLWIVGNGPHRASLEALIAEHGLTTRVRMLGHQFDVCPYMQAADCFVCPSLWAEAAGLVNLEAAACGLPVVASRIGGIPEYVHDGHSGILFEPGDVSALTQALRALMRDHALRSRLGGNARAMAEQRFSMDGRLPAVLDLFR
jgi:glycosyltransferase involved in cell wall biosynthesis